MTTVATAMIDVLTEAGVRHIFGVPSGPWAPYDGCHAEPAP